MYLYSFVDKFIIQKLRVKEAVNSHMNVYLLSLKICLTDRHCQPTSDPPAPSVLLDENKQPFQSSR